ncbi:beta-lactamase family protein [Algoriphagus boseongensis]|uniref:Beta-lactamase family protein n=1 Tax=Algoriphagus boseongensis TaxID=1442587 RepID=A0A4R6T627_9BACT|nr:serine hydrolase [Algoriphagus boseongensis]TDQ17122.1 beta-lactamase family protein [Algoriphagus boseongensis]
MKYFSLVFLGFALWISACSQKEPRVFYEDLEAYPTLNKVLVDSSKYQVQILYSQIDRNEHGVPLFTDYSFNLDDNHYFYPASTVKLPIALLAMEWLEEQNIEGLNLETIMLTDSARISQIPALTDSSSATGLPSIAHYIKKILLVSDNDASNRLYELMGMDYINRKLKEKGLDHTMIMQRLSFPLSPEENRQFNPIRFVDKSGKIILELPARQSDSLYVVPGNPKIGKAYYQGDSLIQSPMDFSNKNKFALSDLHGVVKRLVFPEAFLEGERFQLNEEHRAFALKYMSMLPRESDFPIYDTTEYYDSYSKFFKFGTDKSSIPSKFRIFNKTGWSYGYLIDGSYFVDFESGVEFLVSAIIYVNEDQILNDDKYEYDEIGLPFFSELGDYLYQRELKRKKALPPDLKKFKFEY